MLDTSQSSTLRNLACVVVHYRSYATIAVTVQALIAQGLTPENILVVNNSEQPEMNELLTKSLPSGPQVLHTVNDGYGAAVNAAIKVFSSSTSFTPDYLLVATHETQPRHDTVDLLVRTMAADPKIAVAGPTLISSSDGVDPFVWSTGGHLTKIARLPRHFGHRAAIANYSTKAPVSRTWLDGAFLIYRWADIAQYQIDESFFLYMEETDLHLRLGRQGRLVVWVPGAIVWQSSGGIPPFYLVRNMRLLFRRNGFRLAEALVPLVVVRALGGALVHRRGLVVVQSLIKGFFSPLPQSSLQPNHDVRVEIVNPLRATLAHFELELTDVLASSGLSVNTRGVKEPSTSQKSKGSWLVQYWRLLWEIRRRATPTDSPRRIVSLWPVLGYFDVVVMGVLHRRSSLIIHDPYPLVKAVGYGKVAKFLASRFLRRVELIALSDKAATDIRAQLPKARITTLPHPILNPKRLREPLSKVRPIVQVLGQYKKDRDLGALSEIAHRLKNDLDLRIDGRGWPEVTGWTINARFVPEDELESLIGNSDAIVVPYKRFYQSGIAIRSIERAIPVVGPRDSSLTDMLGAASPLLATESEGSWPSAVESALAAGKSLALTAGISWRQRCESDWKGWSERSGEL